MKFIYRETSAFVPSSPETSAQGEEKVRQNPILTTKERQEKQELAEKKTLENNMPPVQRLKELARRITNIEGEKFPSQEEIQKEISLMPLGEEFSSAILSISKEAQRTIFLGADERTLNFYGREKEIRAIPELMKNLISQGENQEEEGINKEAMRGMSTMNNHEFLKLQEDKRLALVTKGNVSGESVASGNTKEVVFTFTFDGQYNEALWAKTTAGQTLPPHVRTVESEGIEWKRSGVSGEFFNDSGQRLLIHEGTKVSVSKLSTQEELEAIEKAAIEKASKIAPEPKEGEAEYEEKMRKHKIAKKASLEGVDPKFTLVFYEKMLLPELGKEAQNEDIYSRVEDFLTDVDRYKEIFTSLPKLDPNKFRDIKTYDEDGNMTKEFMSYLMGILGEGKRGDIMSGYGFSTEDITATKKFVSLPYRPSGYDYGPWKMEPLDLEKTDYTTEERENLKEIRRFPPGSVETQRLFMNAAKASKLPEEWGKSEALHWILSKESNGVVGRLNYTFKNVFPGSRLDDPQVMNHVHGTLKTGRRLPNRSSATGLGQLLLENVKRYYPTGPNGIGDPLEEAVGMMAYIKDRYGTPERAKALYGTRHEGY